MHVFTSVTTNYIPKARVLATSLKRFHPDAQFHLVLCDALPATWSLADEPFDSVILAATLPISNVHAWLFRHQLVEMCTAVKGIALQEIVRRYEPEKVFYFDPDIAVLSPLDDLLSMLDQKSIILTPHQAVPEDSLEAIADNEICSLRHGVFNLGFLGIRNSAEGLRFADWWSRRLQHFCYDEPDRGLFTDQRWADLAPIFFDDLGIVRDPNCNVATWNLSHRLASGFAPYGIQINGRPLCFYHFSGFDSGAQLAMLEKYGRSSPVLFALRDWYIKRCEEFGQDQLSDIPCVYARFANGEPITSDHRLLYRNRLDLQEAFPNPFLTDNVNRSYFHWYAANAATEGLGGHFSQSTASLELARMQRELQQLKNSIHDFKRSRSWRIASLIANTAGVLNLRRTA